MQVAANDIFIPGTLKTIFAVIAATANYLAKRCYAFAEEGLSAMVFVPNNLPEFRAVDDDIAD